MTTPAGGAGQSRSSFFASPAGWWTTLGLLCLVLLAPLMVVEVPPVLDYPNHLARLYILSQAGHDPVLDAIWQPRWAIIPDVAIDLVGPPLMRVMDPFAAGKILLAMALLAPLAGVVAFSRAAFGQRLYWPMTAGLMAYNLIFILGFLNYLIALGAGLMAAALWMALRNRPPIIRAITGAVCAGGLFFIHLFGVAFFGLLVGAAEAEPLIAGRNQPGLWRRVARVTALIAASFAGPVVLWTLVPPAGPDAPSAYWSFVSKLFFLPSAFEAYHTVPALVVAIVFMWMTGRWIVKRQCALAPGALLVIGVLIILIAVLPLSMAGGAYVDCRIPLMLALVLAAAIRPPPLPDRMRPGAFICVAAIVMIEAYQVGAAWRSYQPEVAELRETIASVPPGSEVLPVSASVDYEKPYWAAAPRGIMALGVLRTDHHLPALLAIDRRAFWPLLFSDPSQHPIRVLPPYDGHVGVGLPVGVDSLAAEQSLDPFAPAPYLTNWPANFDYVLIIDAGSVDDLDHLMPDRLELVKKTRFAALFRVRKADRPATP